jgi:thioredoxin reductase
MKNKFDLTIIGSGPCSIAAFMKVKSKKILVITGQEK